MGSGERDRGWEAVGGEEMVGEVREGWRARWCGTELLGAGRSGGLTVLPTRGTYLESA